MSRQSTPVFPARTYADHHLTATPLQRLSLPLKTARLSESPREAVCESSQLLFSAHLLPSYSPSSADPGRRYITLLNLTWTALMLSTVPGSSFRRIPRPRA